MSGWSRPRAPGAPGVSEPILSGLAVGWGQWLVESYARFGGPLARLAVTARMNAAGLHVSFARQLEALGGNLACAPGEDCGPVSAGAVAWLSAGAVLVRTALAVAIRRRRMRLPWALAVASACLVPCRTRCSPATRRRYLLPAYALLALPAAAGVIHLGARHRLLPRAVPAVVVPVALALAVTVDLTGQLTVARHKTLQTAPRVINDTNTAARLAALGVRPPCLIWGHHAPTVAYQAKCQDWDLASRMYSHRELIRRLTQAAARGQTVAVLSIGHTPPDHPQGWVPHRLWKHHPWYALIHAPAAYAPTR